jgi:hypothetical protein
MEVRYANHYTNGTLQAEGSTTLATGRHQRMLRWSADLMLICCTHPAVCMDGPLGLPGPQCAYWPQTNADAAGCTALACWTLGPARYVVLCKYKTL